jgi:hypothetical protein
MMGRAYCTYFDHRYLPRGLALIQSLRAEGGVEDVWVLCLSDECRDILAGMALPRVRLVSLGELERAYPALAAVKSCRSAVEYYFTATPLIIQFVFERDTAVQCVAYLDADMYFFGPVDVVFAAVGDAPVTIIPHNYAPAVRRRYEKFGIYNVGWVSFDRSVEGQKVLAWWRERCLEWCHDRVDEENDRFADQRYLQRFSAISPATRILRHKGFNVAPWNIANYLLTMADGRVLVGGDPLIFFHFHGVKKGVGGYFFNAHRIFRAPYSALIRRHLYEPYIAALHANEVLMARFCEDGKPVALVRGSRGGFHWKTILLRALQVLDILQGRAIKAAR